MIINMGEDVFFADIFSIKVWRMITMVLAGLTFGEIISDAGLVIAIGLIVVFSVLVLLTLVFKLFGKVMSREEKEPIAMAVPVAAAAPVAPVAAPAAVGNTQPVSTTPAVQNGIPAETVAVISAAVAAVAPAGTQYAVSGIRKK